MNTYGSFELHNSWHGLDSRTTVPADECCPSEPKASPYTSQPLYSKSAATSLTTSRGCGSNYFDQYPNGSSPDLYMECPANAYSSYSIDDNAPSYLGRHDVQSTINESSYSPYGPLSLPPCPTSLTDSILSQPLSYAAFDSSPPSYGISYMLQGVNYQSDAPVNKVSTLSRSRPIISQNYARLRSDPPLSVSDDELRPRRQVPRFTGDEYTATWIRGEGTDRAGWCGICSSWHKLKDSAYWYHMHYSHGISCATGKSFDHPSAWRHAQGAVGYEALCAGCSQWIYIGRLERWQTPYYRHAYKCQMKKRSAVTPVERSSRSSRAKSSSPRKGNGRVMRSV